MSSRPRSLNRRLELANTANGRRSGRWAMVAFSALALVASILASTFGVYRFLMQSPRFAVDEIVVEGHHQLDRERVIELAGITPGANLFALDLTAARERLFAVPWIRSARIDRLLPDRIRIAVVEREAALIANLGDTSYLVSERGEPFKTLEPGDPHDLPVVAGLSKSNLATDRERELARLLEAVNVLRHYQLLEVAARYPLRAIDLEPAGGVSIVVGKDGLVWRLGRGSWRHKLLMAESVLRAMSARGEQASVLFVDSSRHPDRVIARLR